MKRPGRVREHGQDIGLGLCVEVEVEVVLVLVLVIARLGGRSELVASPFFLPFLVYRAEVEFFLRICRCACISEICIVAGWTRG